MKIKNIYFIIWLHRAENILNKQLSSWYICLDTIGRQTHNHLSLYSIRVDRHIWIQIRNIFVGFSERKSMEKKNGKKKSYAIFSLPTINWYVIIEERV